MTRYAAAVHASTGLISILALGFVGITSACGYPYWFVHARNNGVEDVIVRVEYNGGHRDVFLPRATDVDVIKLPGAQPPATVSLLDPVTCAVISSGELPTKSAYVAFGEVGQYEPEELGIFVDDNHPIASLAPSDDRCAQN